MTAAERLLSYLKTISELIVKRRPTTLEEAHAMLDLIECLASSAVVEESPRPCPGPA